MKAVATRNMRGDWSAENFIPMGIATKDGDFNLKISTHKTSSGTLVTSANAVRVQDGRIMWRPFTDFHKQVAQSRVRVTSKAVEAQHQTALALAGELLKDAIAFHEGIDND